MKLNKILVALLLVPLASLGFATPQLFTPSDISQVPETAPTLREAVAEAELVGISLVDDIAPTVDAGKPILFIDGPWYEAATDATLSSSIRGRLLAGTPTFIFGGDVSLLRQGINDIGYEVYEGDLEAYGIKIHPGQRVDDTLVSEQLYIGGASDVPIREAVQVAFEWASARALPTGPNFVSVSKPQYTHTTCQDGFGAPYWCLKAQFLSYDTWSPYGKLNTVRTWWKLVNDGSSSYHWRDMQINLQTVPGKVAWGNGWHNADQWATIDVNYLQPSDYLVDYQPTVTLGVNTVTVSIGVTAGAEGASVTAGQSWSYSVPDVAVQDTGDYSLQLAEWWHNINMDKLVGESTYQSKPGLTARLPSFYSSFNLQQKYRAGFAIEKCGWWFFGSCLYWFWDPWYSPWVNINTYGV